MVIVRKETSHGGILTLDPLRSADTVESVHYKHNVTGFNLGRNTGCHNLGRETLAAFIDCGNLEAVDVVLLYACLEFWLSDIFALVETVVINGSVNHISGRSCSRLQLVLYRRPGNDNVGLPVIQNYLHFIDRQRLDGVRHIVLHREELEDTFINCPGSGEAEVWVKAELHVSIVVV